MYMTVKHLKHSKLSFKNAQKSNAFGLTNGQMGKQDHIVICYKLILSNGAGETKKVSEAKHRDHPYIHVNTACSPNTK